MRVCYFGDFPPNSPRNVVLQEGLRKAGVDVYTCRIENIGLLKYWEIFCKIRTLPKDTDIILIAFSTSRFVWFVWLLTRKPIVWNAFYSIYGNWVYDRKRVSPGSPKALWLWILDFICCHTADKIILEANADIAYFKRTFKVPAKKFVRIFVGYNEHVMQPRAVRTHDLDQFIVEFHGGYIPVQGVEYIIEAAKLLEQYTDIRFKLIGHGQTYTAVRAQADKLKINNVTFIPKSPPEKIADYIAEADVCIGLVSDVERINQAIPHKVYEASGVRRASINADTDAIHELFTDRENILLVERGNAHDLADKILELRNNPILKDKIAENAYKIVRERASIEVLGKELAEELVKLIKL